MSDGFCLIVVISLLTYFLHAADFIYLSIEQHVVGCKFMYPSISAQLKWYSWQTLRTL